MRLYARDDLSSTWWRSSRFRVLWKQMQHPRRINRPHTTTGCKRQWTTQTPLNHPHFGNSYQDSREQRACMKARVMSLHTSWTLIGSLECAISNSSSWRQHSLSLWRLSLQGALLQKMGCTCRGYLRMHKSRCALLLVESTREFSITPHRDALQGQIRASI